jgi:hypothetical protein
VKQRISAIMLAAVLATIASAGTEFTDLELVKKLTEGVSGLR